MDKKGAASLKFGSDDEPRAGRRWLRKAVSAAAAAVSSAEPRRDRDGSLLEAGCGSTSILSAAPPPSELDWWWWWPSFPEDMSA